MQNITRRSFLQVIAAGSGSFVLGFQLQADQKALYNNPQSFTPNAWIKIDANNAIEIKVGSVEMGQGATTALPMIVADEMDANWDNVTATIVGADSTYKNPSFGMLLTGGSRSITGYWNVLREAGATAKAMLLQAAANLWQVDVLDCYAQKGQVIYQDKSISYGELVDIANQLVVPDLVFLKDPEEFTIIGQPIARLDMADKINGKAQFGLDVYPQENTLVAVVARCPIIGGKAKSFNLEPAKNIKGVKKVVEISSGFAVIAENFWSAKKGRDALQITWQGDETLNTESITKAQKAAIDKGNDARNDGNAENILNTSKEVIEAVYQVPYLAHICMEPMNCTSWIKGDECHIWAPTQSQTNTHQTAIKVTGFKEDKVFVYPTFLGGGLGRRGEKDFVAESVEIAKQVDLPVKLVWTREDDIKHDFYRPATYNVLRASLDKKGLPQAWQHKIAGNSIMSRVFPFYVHGGIDHSSVEGASNIPYTIDNVHVTTAIVKEGPEVGFWRSVGNTQNLFISESFLSELAYKAGQDPYQYRRTLLKNNKDKRYLEILDLAAEKANWNSPLEKGQYRGIAVGKSFGSYVAEVAEISIVNKKLKVHRIICAIDCGIAVNPDTIEAQVQGSVANALSTVLYEKITIENGRIQQNNFYDYPILPIQDMPKVEVYILPSTKAPGGVGEPATPLVAPAIANAVLQATGKPVRSLPITL